MTRHSLNTLSTRVLIVVGIIGCTCRIHAQALPAATDPATAAAQRARAIASDAKVYSAHARDYLSDRREVSLAVTYEDSSANLTYASPLSFQTQGGGIELSARFRDGFGAVGSIHAFHTNESGHQVPVNVLVEAFGPRYTFRPRGNKHPLSLFIQGLIGEANGFDGLYPNASGPKTSASSVAYEPGGGIDVVYTPRLSIRVLQADWVRTGLPNATNNVQNTFRLGVGIVIHTPHRPAEAGDAH
jgi:hypothetical protein